MTDLDRSLFSAGYLLGAAEADVSGGVIEVIGGRQDPATLRVVLRRWQCAAERALAENPECWGVVWYSWLSWEHWVPGVVAMTPPWMDRAPTPTEGAPHG